MIYEKCPKCGKKGLYESNFGGTINRALTRHRLGDKECRYCGYSVKVLVIPPTRVHYQAQRDHAPVPLCAATGPSHSMSKSIRLIDCPACLRLLDCSWCNGRGSYVEYGEKQICGQCCGTGYSQEVEL